MKTQFSVMFNVLLILSIYNGYSQGIQPLGIRNGSYSIAPNSSSVLNAFCVDKSILTSVGFSYTKVLRGSENSINIGGQNYTLQEALDRNLIAIQYSGKANGQMQVKVQNRTNKAVIWNITQDFVLGNNENLGYDKPLPGLNLAVRHVPQGMSN